MKKKETTVRKGYLRPSVSIFNVFEEHHLLAGSPGVRPGGGGQGAQQGTIQVIGAPEEDGGDDDILEG